jgi:poly(3-hydroxybutyrate) depolymerase
MCSEARRGLFAYRLSALVLLLLAIAACHAEAASRRIKIPEGPGNFDFVDPRGDRTKQTAIYTYVPEGIDVTKAPIAFIIHGAHRSVEGVRDDWERHADKYGFIVIAPLFDKEQWGHFETAGIFSRSGTLRDKSQTSYYLIEHLFDAVKQATGNTTERYFLYGFSEGGQFTQRFVLFMPEARYVRAVIGSPSHYMMPRFDVKFPYGLKGAPATAASLRPVFGRDVVLLLADQDNDPNHPQLSKTPEAEAQGPHRVARGHTYFNEVRKCAARLKTPLRWRLRTVHGAGHSPKRVSSSAAALLMGKDPPANAPTRAGVPSSD